MKKPWLLAVALFLAAACQRPGTAGPEAAACIDPSKITSDGICTMDYTPVCGCDGKTYSNACVAGHAGVRRSTPGPCPAAPSK